MVWLASDEDREGEAIAWHLYELLGLNKDNTKRIVFREITKNAVLNSMKEIGQRYDFKGSISQIDLESDSVVVTTEDDLKARQVSDILIGNLIRRKIDPKALKEVSREPASRNNIRIRFEILQGIQKYIRTEIL